MSIDALQVIALCALFGIAVAAPTEREDHDEPIHIIASEFEMSPGGGYSFRLRFSIQMTNECEM